MPANALPPTIFSILLAVITVVSFYVWPSFFKPTRTRKNRKTIKRCLDLYESIRALPTDVAWYADPSRLRLLPFPSLDKAQRDRFEFNEHNCFTYVGREKFPDIANAIRKAIDSGDRCKFNLYGTTGYGKSHILAALACYFTCLDQPVVYIPNSADLVSDFVTYVQLALMNAYAIRFSQCTDENLLFIVDQFDAVDVNKNGIDSGPRLAAASALKRLTTSMDGRVIVETASANSLSYEKVRNSRRDAKIFLFGGMSRTEMVAGWKLWDAEKRLPFFKEPDSRSQIEYMTGRIPLLLSPPLAFSGQTFEDVAESYWTQDIVRRPQDDILRFAVTYKAQFAPLYDDFIQTMGHFLTSKIQGAALEAQIDRRYLYNDENRRGRIVCGIAREALASVVHQASPRLPLGAAWTDALYQYRDNPSVLGFLVEQQCIATVASSGLAITTGLEIPVTSIKPFVGDVVKLWEPGFYVPIKPNCMAINCIYAIVDETESTAHIIPIQITIAKAHSDSEASFLRNWTRWTEALTERKYKIKVTFVWIVEDGKSIQHVEEVQQALQSGQKRGRPAYSSYHIPLSDETTSLQRS